MADGKARLEGKVAIVTGAGSSGPGYGTGKATSVLFAREGARVLLADRDANRAGETSDIIAEEGGEASVFEADVTSSDDCRAMVEAAVERYGRLDVLMNNVAVIKTGTVVEVDEEDWDTAMDVNLKGMMLASKHAIPAMIETGGGSIVNISSVEAVRSGSFAALTPYSVSKGGVVTLTLAMAVQHGRENIRSNCILPGYIYTPMVAPPVGGGAEPAGQGRPARHRGHGVGHSPRGAVPVQRRCALGDGRADAGRRRAAGGVAAVDAAVPDGVSPGRV